MFAASFGGALYHETAKVMLEAGVKAGLPPTRSAV